MLEVNKRKTKRLVGQTWISSWDLVQLSVQCLQPVLPTGWPQDPCNPCSFRGQRIKHLPPFTALPFLSVPFQHVFPSPSQQNALLASEQFWTCCHPQPSAAFQERKPVTGTTFRKLNESQNLISHQPSSRNNFQQLGFELNQWPAPKWKAPNTIIIPQSCLPCTFASHLANLRAQISLLDVFMPVLLPKSLFSRPFAECLLTTF